MQDDAHLVTLLLNRRNELAREAVRLKERVTTLKVDVQAIDKALRVLRHDGELTAPQRLPNTARLFGPRELPRLLAEVLREATEGLSAREVTLGVMRLKGWDVDDVRFERALCEKVGRTLWKRRKRDAVRMTKRGGENVWWAAAPDMSA